MPGCRLEPVLWLIHVLVSTTSPQEVSEVRSDHPYSETYRCSFLIFLDLASPGNLCSKAPRSVAREAPVMQA